ncbi:MAG: hypothetical protein SGILL_002006 [Bacillariaceae sp.]
MPILRDVTSTSCSLGMGVQAFTNNNNTPTPAFLSGLEPMNTVLSALQDSFNNGLTMSFWIKHPEEEDLGTTSQPILTIGTGMQEEGTANDNGPLTFCDTFNLDFQLSMIGRNQLEWVFRTRDPFFSPCQRIVVDISSTNHDFAHISISLTNLHQKLYYNGELISEKREMFDNKLRHWDDSGKVQFFSYPDVASIGGNTTNLPWRGQLLQFSMYSGMKDRPDVIELLSEALPPTQPFALPMVAHIWEDGMDHDGNIQALQLPIWYVDQEVDNLLSYLDVVHQPASKPQLYITNFPSRGSLMSTESNHTIMAVEDAPVWVQQADQDLIFLPNHNEYSDFSGSSYASFEFCWSTNAILSSSQCASATVSVVVDSVNDPPVATIPSLYRVHEGINEEDQAMKLTGTDVDKDDFINAVQITSQPSLGYLYLSVGTFRQQDHLLHGTLLSEINNTVYGKQAYVEYRFTGYDEVVLQDNSVKEYFKFRVQDSFGAWSDEVEAEILVLPNIFSEIKSNRAWTIPSLDGQAQHSVSWDDKSGLNRTTGIYIESLPKKGTLRDESNEAIETQAVVTSSVTGVGLNVSYHAALGACNQEEDFYSHDSFTYRVVSLGIKGQITTASKLKTHNISVQCTVEPLLLKADYTSMNVSVFPFRMDHACSGYMFNFSEESKQNCSDSVALPSFSVQNIHRLDEPILVSISTMSGFLTLNHEISDELSPISDQEQMRPNIRLLSPPEMLSDVLSSIHFQSDIVGEDTVRVVIEYGRCSHNTADLLKQGVSSLYDHDECVQEEATVQVRVLPNPEKGTVSYCKRDFPWVPLPFAIFMILFIKMRGWSREVLLKYEQSHDGHTCQLTSEGSQDIKWQQYYDQRQGMMYYKNLEDGEITWTPPENNEQFIPCPETQVE